MSDNSKSEKYNANNLCSLEEVGGLLRQARENKNISIEDLAKSLNLGREQLIAIEAGNRKLLPEMVFIKGMIKRISDRLEFDPNIVIEKLQIENQNENENENDSEFERAKSNEYLKGRKKLFKPLLITLALGMSFLAIALLEIVPETSLELKKENNTSDKSDLIN